MKFQTKILFTVAFGTGAIAFGHHLAIPLSSAFGTEILTKVTWFAKSDVKGVPAYHVGSSDHHFDIHDGATFTIHAGGASESVSFSASQFAAMDDATSQEVIDAINSQLTIARAEIDNNTLVVRGLEGGSSSNVSLVDGAGAPLAALGFVPGTIQGTDKVELSISIPPEDDHDGGTSHDLAGHPYLVIASTTAGSTNVAGSVIPLALDAFTVSTVRATQLGILPGFVGKLDANSDASATFDPTLIEAVFGDHLPPRAYLSYVVFSHELDSIEFVSNAFEIQVVE